MPRLIVIPIAFVLAACPPAEDRGSGGGGPHCSGPQLPVGASEDSTFIYRCRFSEATDWVTPSGATKHWAKDSWPTSTCSTNSYASYDCFERCAGIAEDFGVLDTNAACTNTYGSSELFTPLHSCGYLIQCNVDDFPDPQIPAPDDTATLFCMADLDEADQPHDCDIDDGALWWIDDDGLCGSASPTTPCGFPVYGVEVGDDPDQQCKDVCASQIAHPYTDANITNCDHFVQATTCPMGIAPGHGTKFAWQTQAGSTEAPLACDGGPCCGKFGAVACTNLGSAKVVAEVAQRHTPITVPVRLEAHGVVSTGTVTGVLAYSVTACAAGRTCPIYIESLTLGSAKPFTGTWVDPAGRRVAFSLAHLAIASSGPAIGGHRSTGELQLRPHTLELDVTADVTARSIGWVDASLGLASANAATITGRITPNGVTLSTTLQLEPGVRLVIGG